ncbi:hypothetical protein B0T21DRAFT_43424 [Apiosordaria backusii]|uniref:Uncharacterized protein n=1 Tax=Apiosordaria backusii TaxID=314023 RepID=A0AA40AXG6_9PEZI|nr:hypothetical protein B0T21DRAFT_43424 [Apiosordaria backusii]
MMGDIAASLGTVGLVRDTYNHLLFFFFFLYTTIDYLHMAGHRIPFFFLFSTAPALYLDSQGNGGTGKERRRRLGSTVFFFPCFVHFPLVLPLFCLMGSGILLCFSSQLSLASLAMLCGVFKGSDIDFNNWLDSSTADNALIKYSPYLEISLGVRGISGFSLGVITVANFRCTHSQLGG